METTTMNRTNQGWPAAGIDSTEAARAFKRATSPLKVCDSTPSLIENEAGDIVAQTFERYDVDVTDKGRTAEMWARAQVLASAPALLKALCDLVDAVESNDRDSLMELTAAHKVIGKALRR